MADYLDELLPSLQAIAKPASMAPAPMAVAPMRKPAPVKKSLVQSAVQKIGVLQNLQNLDPTEMAKIALTPDGAAAIKRLGLQTGIGATQSTEDQEHQDWLDKNQVIRKDIGETMIAPKDAIHAMQLVGDNPMPGAQLARSATEGVQDAISKVKAQPLTMQGVDLRPLAGLIDNWYGSKMLDSTPAPETERDRQVLLAGLQEKLADNAAKQSHFETMLFNAMKTQPSFVQDTHGGQVGGGTKSTEKQGVNVTINTPKEGAGGKDWQPQVEQYRKNTQGPEKVLAALAQIDRLVPGGISAWNGQSIPGAGFGGTIGGYLTENGRAMKQAVNDLKMGLMHENFGSRQTKMEAQSLGNAIGTNTWSTEAQFVQGLRQAAEKAKKGYSDAEMSAYAGRNGPQVQNYLNSYDGVTHSGDVPVYSGAGAAHGTVGGPASKRRSVDEMLQQYGGKQK